jgi:hypothetical protein
MWEAAHEGEIGVFRFVWDHGSIDDPHQEQRGLHSDDCCWLLGWTS